MNPLNVASLEASKRLVDAGIVIETEAVWGFRDGIWTLFEREGIELEEVKKWIPAPCMAEVWRELPSKFRGADIEVGRTVDGLTFAAYHTPPDYEDDFGDDIVSFRSVNPTDALIDLRIWIEEHIRREK